MRPVSTGTQKVTMNEGERDYEAKRRAAMNASSNQYVSGIEHVFKEGVGEDISKSRTNYGAVRDMPETAIEGESSNFAQDSDAGNNPNTNPVNTTGSLVGEVSATTVPQEDPSEFQTDALAKRIEMMKGTMPQGESSLNRREQTMRG